MSSATHRLGARVALGSMLVTPLLLVAAGGSASALTGAADTATQSAAARASAAKVETRSGSLGTYLTDGAGRTLYLFKADHGGTSSCTGACASSWPPLTTKGKPTAGGKAKPGKLGTIKRSDGSKQVTYAGHPLYRYSGDASAGQTNGEGSVAYGAKWWIVSPAGKAIKN